MGEMGETAPGAGVSFGVMKMSWNFLEGMVANTVNVRSATELYTLKR